MTFEQYVSEHLTSANLTHKALELVRMGWNARGKYGDAGGVPKGTNDFGLDAGYFHGKLRLILRDINSYTPTEMARALGRLAITANSETMREPELNVGALIDEPRYRDATPQPADKWIKCGDDAEFPTWVNGEVVWVYDENLRSVEMVSWAWVRGLFGNGKVTHWMPTGLKRPSPPQRSKGDE